MGKKMQGLQICTLGWKIAVEMYMKTKSATRHPHEQALEASGTGSALTNLV